MGSSAQAQIENPKKHKRKIAEITDAGDTPPADLAEEPVNAARGKRKKINGTHSRLRKESSPITGDSDFDDVNLTSDAQKKRSRRSQTAAREIPSGT
jgi:hypothetical protein